MANADTEQKRLSSMLLSLPFRGPGVWPADTGFKVASRQAAINLYSGVGALTYKRGIAAPFMSNAVEAPVRN